MATKQLDPDGSLPADEEVKDAQEAKARFDKNKTRIREQSRNLAMRVLASGVPQPGTSSKDLERKARPRR